MPKLPPLPVSQIDLANLQASGLTRSTIRASRVRSDNGELVFPYYTLEGQPMDFERRRLRHPRNDGAKYLQQKGTGCRAYFAPASRKLIGDADVIYITEGEKKALALSQLGLPVIGIAGVNCGMTDGELIPDLKAIDWTGRKVGIVFDYDEKTTARVNVALARRKLAQALMAAGASEVFNVEIPPAADGSKQGVDDYLVACGKSAERDFGGLLAEAEPVIPEDDDSVIKIIPTAPPELGEAAYHGFPGDFVRSIARFTEATDSGVLAHLLAACGAVIGPGPHIYAGSKQNARINAVLVGRTNAGRKGTSASPVDELMQRVDHEWWSHQRVNGLSSGEGLIAYVADRETTDESGGKVTELVEKRLCVVEEEFSRVLAQMRREGNILSQVIRSAFDNGNLNTLTVNPRHAHNAHISIVGHITPEELKERLNHIEMANGFGNRFLWFFVESDKVMPRTTPIPDSVFIPFEPRLRTLMDNQKERVVVLDKQAVARWKELYPQLRKDQPGLAGAMVARGSSMVLRVALIYAMLEKTPKVLRLEHLEAALAVWRYCEQSAHMLFESQTGDKLCDKLVELLRSGPMTRNDFNKHLSIKQKGEVGKALEKLKACKVVRKTKLKQKGPGRPATQWELT